MPAQLASLASVRIDSNPPLPATPATVVVAEFPVSHRECLRASITHDRRGSVVSLTRWKCSPDGTMKRTSGHGFDFAAHRLHAVIRLLADVENLMHSQQKFFDGRDADLADDEELARDVAALAQGGAR